MNTVVTKKIFENYFNTFFVNEFLLLLFKINTGATFPGGKAKAFSFVGNELLNNQLTQECHGWSVELEDGTELVQLNGDDFVLDCVGELELPPAFPASPAQFLVSHDRSRGQVPLTVDTKEGRQQFRHSSSPRGAKQQKQQRSKSQDRLLALPDQEKDFGLSNSALNDRYFSDVKSTRR